jgi:hypothetical protein
MAKERKRSRWWIAVIVLILLAAVLALILFLRSEYARHQISELHGSIFGNEYIIDTFDNNGIKTLTTHGRRIDISANKIDESMTTGDDTGKLETLSSVITITVDGKQLISCGDTCIFYDKDLKPDYEFYLDTIDSEGNGGLSESVLISGRVNSIRNYIGKPMVVVIKSQTGAPIYVFSGRSVYWEVSEDLPKFTKLSIDGKPLYIHRANFQIIDYALIG